MLADEVLQLGDQLEALFLRDKFGTLDRVHQQFQFRDLKVAVTDIVPRRMTADPADIQPEVLQDLHIVIDGFAARLNIVAFQLLDQLCHSQRVFLVGFLQQDLLQIEQLLLLVGTFGHSELLYTILHIIETISGMVMSESTVVSVTTLTDSSTSRLNLAANMVVVAAVGAALAIVNAMTIVLSKCSASIAKAAANGMMIRRNRLARYAPPSVNALRKFAFER